MYERVAGISNKNGYEFYWGIYNSFDAIPANAEFTYDQALMQLAPMYAGKVNHLKDLYEFRVVLRENVHGYKKEIGKEPDHNKLKDILFACMDVNSKQLISSAGLDKNKFIGEEGNKVEVDTYNTFVDDIDRRYRVEFGT